LKEGSLWHNEETEGRVESNYLQLTDMSFILTTVWENWGKVREGEITFLNTYCAFRIIFDDFYKFCLLMEVWLLKVLSVGLSTFMNQI
jgi:hypothetical protein